MTLYKGRAAENSNVFLRIFFDIRICLISQKICVLPFFNYSGFFFSGPQNLSHTISAYSG